jgi:hypothetical protein
VAECSEPKLSYRAANNSERTVPFDRMRVRDLTAARPWRTLRWYHGQPHYAGMYWSATMEGHVVYESRLELARLLLADFDPGVVTIVAQPFQLTTWVDGRPRRHVPDFLLLDRSGLASVVDVKPVGLITESKVAKTLAWAGGLIEAHGWRFEVWSGCDGTLLKNVRFLAGYRRLSLFDQEFVAKVLSAVSDGDSIEAVEQRLATRHPAHAIRPALLHLLWRCVLSADLNQTLTGTTTLRRTRERAA